MRRVGLLLCCGLPFALSGCYAATIGLVWSILYLVDSSNEGDAGPDVPRVADLRVLPAPGAPRAVDLSAVKIRFRLVERTEEPANLIVKFRVPGEGWEDAKIAEPLTGLSTSADGTPVTLTWDASADRKPPADHLSGYVRVDLTVTASDKDGGTTSPVLSDSIGNDAPKVTTLEVRPGEEGSDFVRGTAVVRFELEDTAGDPSSIEFLVAPPGEEFRTVCAAPGTSQAADCPDVLVGQREDLLPGAHDFAWDTARTLGRTDLEGVRVAVRPTDFLGAAGDPTASAEFRVHNNSPPDVVVIEPTSNPDEDGPCLLQFLLRDAEGDPADVVLQWAESEGDFAADPAFDLSDLSDPDVRRRVLLDPDERAPRRIITPRLRALIEGRGRVADGSAENEFVLWGIHPQRPLTDEALRGHALELLSEWGAVEATGRIAAADPAGGRIWLERPLDPKPRQGQRARVRETLERLCFGLQTASTGKGAMQEIAWDVPADVGGVGPGGRYFLRATAFNAGVRDEGTSYATSVAKPIAVRSARFIAHSEHPGTGDVPHSVTAADFNGDGRPDLVSADSGADELSVFLGLGDGNFVAHPERPRAGEQPESVTAADFNGDGSLDLVSTDMGASQLSVFLGQGDGSFVVHPKHPSALSFPLSVSAADLDGDSRPDLVSADSYAKRLSVFLGRGDGSFLVHPEHPSTGTNPGSVIAADVDGDARVDLVSADAGADQLSVFLGRGDGSFAAEPGHPSTGGGPGAVTAADLNGDGRLDVVSSDRDPDKLSVFLNQPDGSLAVHPEQPGTAEGSHSAIATDLDGDGHLDLVIGGSQLSVLLGRGDGSFVAHPEHPRTGPYLTAGDLNGDGHPDLVSASTVDVVRSGKLSVFLGQGDGSFVERSQHLSTGAEPQSVVAADLNGDGRLDLVSADYNALQLSVFLGQGDGSFIDHPEHPSTGGNPSSVTAGDFDGDGRLDLVAVDSYAGQLAVFLGQGDGSFVAHPERPRTGELTKSATAADLNGDGRLDLVSAAWDPDQLSIFLGQGDGSFIEHPDHPGTGDRPQSVTTADIDGDGRLDLVSADAGDDRLSIFLGRGDGSFVAHPDQPRTGSAPFSVAAADLNSDGRSDLVATLASADRISVILNAGTYPLPPFLAPPRARAPTAGNGRGGALDGTILAPRQEAYRLDASMGTLDGRRLDAYLGHAFHFASIAVPEGVTIRVVGDEPLVLLASGDVIISGTLELGGSAGKDAGPMLEGRAKVGGNGNAGAAGGAAGPGGAPGGAGGGTDPGSGSIHGRPGFGPGGGGGARLAEGSRGPAPGGGGGFSGAGDDGLPPAAPAGLSGARGGSAHGNAFIDPVYGGSGGGGGSIREGSGGKLGALDNGDAQGLGGDLGGGGGGGGGGAVRITAGGNIIVTAAGKVIADGGPGGAGAPGRIRFEDSDGQVEAPSGVFPDPALGRLPPEPEAPYGGAQVPGDLNQDARLDLADAIALLRLLFAPALAGGAGALPCGESSPNEGGDLLLLDSDGSGRVDLTDGIRLLAYLFQSGPPHILGTGCTLIPGCPNSCTTGL